MSLLAAAAAAAYLDAKYHISKDVSGLKTLWLGDRRYNKAGKSRIQMSKIQY